MLPSGASLLPYPLAVTFALLLAASATAAAVALSRVDWRPAALIVGAPGKTEVDVLLLRAIVALPLALSFAFGFVCWATVGPPLGKDLLLSLSLQLPAAMVAGATLMRGRTLSYHFSSRAQAVLASCAAVAAVAQLLIAYTPTGTAGQHHSAFAASSAALLSLNLAPLLVMARLTAAQPWQPGREGAADTDADDDGTPPFQPPPPLLVSAACAVLYAASLAWYATAGPFVAPLEPTATSLAAAAVLCLDGLALLHQRSGALSSRVSLLALCATTRVVLIACGESHVATGEALLYALHGGLLGRRAIALRNPPPPSPLRAYLASLVAAREGGGEEATSVAESGKGDDGGGGTSWAELWRSVSSAEASLCRLTAAHAVAVLALAGTAFRPLTLGGCALPQVALGALAPFCLVLDLWAAHLLRSWRRRGARPDEQAFLRAAAVWSVVCLGCGAACAALLRCALLLPLVGLLPGIAFGCSALRSAWESNGWVAIDVAGLKSLTANARGYAILGEDNAGSDSGSGSAAGRGGGLQRSFARAVKIAHEESPRDVALLGGAAVVTAQVMLAGVAFGCSLASAAAGAALTLLLIESVLTAAALTAAHHRPDAPEPLLAFCGAFAATHLAGVALLAALWPPPLQRPASSEACAFETVGMTWALLSPLALCAALLWEFADDVDRTSGATPRHLRVAAVVTAATASALIVVIATMSLAVAALSSAAVALAFAATYARHEAAVNGGFLGHNARSAVERSLGGAVAVGTLVGVSSAGAVAVAGWTLSLLASASVLAAAARASLRRRKGQRLRHWSTSDVWWLPLPSTVVMADGEVRPSSEPVALLLAAAAATLLWSTYATLVIAPRAVGVVTAWAVALALIDQAAAAAASTPLALGRACRRPGSGGAAAVRCLLTYDAVSAARKAAFAASVEGQGGAHESNGGTARGSNGGAAPSPDQTPEGAEAWLVTREGEARRALRLAEAGAAAGGRGGREAAWSAMLAAEAVLATVRRERMEYEARLAAALLQAAAAAAEGEARELLLFASSELSSRGAAVSGGGTLEEEVASLNVEERGLLEEAAADFLAARRRQRQLDEERAEEEARRAAARTAALRVAEARRRKLDAVTADGAGRLRLLRLKLRDAGAEASLQADEVEAASEALPRGWSPPARPTSPPPLDAEAVAAQSEAEEQKQVAAFQARCGLSEGDNGNDVVAAARTWYDEEEARLAQACEAMVDYAEKLASIARGSADALSLRVSAFDDEDAAAAEARRRAAAGERRRAADAARRDREREEEAAATRGGDGGADPMESLVKPILARHGAGCEWEDVAFPAADASLPASAHGAKWQRARQLCLAPVVFGRSSKAADADAIDPSDISQGALGTCYFLSALSVAATRPQLIRSCFVTTEPNEAGCYCVRLFRDGRPRHILVDDQLPAHGHGRPLFAASKQRDELWVSLLEKAYAKLFSSYAAIEGGHVDEALVDLTGGVGGENLSLAEEGRDPDRLWSRLTGFVHAGYLLGAGSPAGTDTDVSAEGIVQGHAYSCLRVAEEEGHRLLQLRNPWGRTEWRGDWSDASHLWTPRLKARLGWSDADDGTFWIGLKDFCASFAQLYVCKIPNPSWAHAELQGEWRGESAGGCSNYDTVGANPQWSITIGERPVACLVCLAQADARGTDLDGDGVEDEPFPIGLSVVYKRGERVRKLYASDWCARTAPFRNTREVSLDVTLEPRSGGATTTYTLLPSTFEPGQERNFRIRVFSDRPVEVAPLR